MGTGFLSQGIVPIRLIMRIKKQICIYRSPRATAKYTGLQKVQGVQYQEA